MSYKLKRFTLTHEVRVYIQSIQRQNVCPKCNDNNNLMQSTVDAAMGSNLITSHFLRNIPKLFLLMALQVTNVTFQLILFLAKDVIHHAVWNMLFNSS